MLKGIMLNKDVVHPKMRRSGARGEGWSAGVGFGVLALAFSVETACYFDGSRNDVQNFRSTELS